MGRKYIHATSSVLFPHVICFFYPSLLIPFQILEYPFVTLLPFLKVSYFIMKRWEHENQSDRTRHKQRRARYTTERLVESELFYSPLYSDLVLTEALYY